MFGTYRTLLALAVVVHHLISISVIGHYAVHGFFILSGYLMTYIMNKSYGYSYDGIKSFAKNRFLRLYPSYWVILAISLLIIAYWGEDQSRVYRSFIFVPKDLLQWAQNITLVFANVFPLAVSPRISPPTWALTIELFFYLLIAIGLSKTKKLTLIWLIVSVISMLATHLADLGYEYRYSIILAGSLPFSLGATVYHFRDYLCKTFLSISKPLPIVLLFSLFVVNSLFGAAVRILNWDMFLFDFSFYLNYLINVLLVISLINGSLPFISQKLDKKIGDFSYPIYLFHWQAGFLSSMLIWNEPINGFNIKGIISCVVAIIICFFVSWLIIKFVDHPIQKLRIRIKIKNKNKNYE